jgi:hypothetical protein
MHRGNVYPVLAELLDEWRRRPSSELIESVGKAAVSRELEVAGEIYTVDLRVRWPEARRDAVVIEAVACGYNNQVNERFEERVEVPVSGDSR